MIEDQIILNQMPGGVLVINNEYRICYLNDWIVEVTGFSRNELESSFLTKIISGLSLNDNLNENGIIPYSCNMVTSSGNIIPVHLTAHTVPAPDMFYIYLCVIRAPDSNYLEELPLIDTATRDHFFGLYGKSQKMQELYEFIEMAAQTDANVVIQGESGTGKELAAFALHHASNRNGKPFVKVNCAALTENLLESELFGHARGAFTGAYSDHKGKFEYADKGTIFLDEIGEISASMQVKLLRVLQERVVTRVGDNREILVDVRVITATNKSLRSLVSKDKFREDLFYRLNVFPIHMPALRERATDIPILIDHFMKKFRTRTGKQIESCSSDVMRILMAYCWPGNVRELENIIEHGFILSRSKEIQVIDLPHELRVSAVREGICAEKIAGIMQTISTSPVHFQKESNRLSISREMLEQELARHGGNKTATARALGISKVGLWKKMKKLGMI
jgi:two-component system response regulator HydG